MILFAFTMSQEPGPITENTHDPCRPYIFVWHKATLESSSSFVDSDGVLEVEP